MSENAAAMSRVQVDFTLRVGQGQMQVSAVVPQERVNLVQLLPSLKQISSNIVNAITEAVEKEGYRISCKAGCGACCRQLVPLTFFEAEELANWIRSLPQEQQAILEGRFDAALLQLKALGLLERLDFRTLPSAGAEGNQLAKDYLRAGVSCPFLQDESCGIHPIRPLICREYLVTSPAEFCADPNKMTVKPVPMPVRLSKSLDSLGADMTEERRGWIPLTFLFAWMRSGTKVAHAYEGTGPDLLRLVIEKLATNNDAPESAVG